MTNKALYHINLSDKDTNGALYAILPGDPARVLPLAQSLDRKAIKLSEHREYTSYLANFHNQPVIICSTGIGGPSCSIAVEELAKLGIQYFVRIGTTGAIQTNIKLGDLIIAKAAVREDGASKHYAPIAYPAVASMRFSAHFMAAADKNNIQNHVGIVVSSDTFYPGQERYDSHSQYVRKSLQGSLKEWQKLNIASFEMEAATLFTMCNVFGLEAACLLGVIAHRNESELVNASALKKAQLNWTEVLTKGLASHMRAKGYIKETP